ncbi:N-acetyllactosaminide 3-alpha-galactosyltransferase [Oesophagostomum dentatum]|uniref:N-acetyllactosaminide 3-alpha-galactosyltransferase n=1 Tax=Oesophagostomum dentatum TaxID=61180 RepID=A0A0B1SUT0_OESDE|nr:N-acetyllactosaminide 3-alpha-galactosyltransferase [Oesophagostomum dentatum]
MEVLPFEELAKKYSYLAPGGHYSPKTCKPLNKLAVIIPYRDRASHLHVLLNNMHPFLTDQFLDYSIIVVEQASNQTFNRGKLLNVGFVEAMKLYEWDCVLLHDVDLLPEDRRNLHVCKRYDYTMSLDIDWPPCEQHPISDNDRLAYNGMFGTSSMLSTAQFRKVNGLSNRFWGWGGEDDDLYTR